MNKQQVIDKLNIMYAFLEKDDFIWARKILYDIRDAVGVMGTIHLPVNILIDAVNEIMKLKHNYLERQDTNQRLLVTASCCVAVHIGVIEATIKLIKDL